jgi:hypothetical protein
MVNGAVSSVEVVLLDDAGSGKVFWADSEGAATADTTSAERRVV